MALVEHIRNVPSITLQPETLIQYGIAMLLILGLGLPALCAPQHRATSELEWHGNSGSRALP
ncbi:hypothetical protein [Epibacterium ulvae]|uniref:hypothetical protein n=1 Tax=Epibacterium ulvae TaxID=1156985 RepID=UPI00248FC2C8|nr:hypothetical protein [Epibacterium ulvae]